MLAMRLFCHCLAISQATCCLPQRNAVFPEEWLAQSFERISLQNMLKRDGACFRFGEADLGNAAMMRQLVAKEQKQATTRWIG